MLLRPKDETESIGESDSDRQICKGDSISDEESVRSEVGLEDGERCESLVESDLVDGLEVRYFVVEKTSQVEKRKDELQKKKEGRKSRLVRTCCQTKARDEICSPRSQRTKSIRRSLLSVRHQGEVIQSWARSKRLKGRGGQLGRIALKEERDLR